MDEQHNNDTASHDQCDKVEASRRPGESHSSSMRSSDMPEPPTRWSPSEQRAGIMSESVESDTSNATGMGAVGSVQFNMTGSEIVVFQSARNYITASQIIAVVSLFFGGMLVSSIAVICAFVAYGKLDRLAAARDSEPDVQRAIRRSGKIVIALAIGAMAINALAIALLYPMLVESGSLSSLFGLTGSSAATGTNTTWG